MPRKQNRARKTTDMEAAREHGNQVPMRNAHARHKLNTYSYTMRVKEVVKLTNRTYRYRTSLIGH